MSHGAASVMVPNFDFHHWESSCIGLLRHGFRKKAAVGNGGVCRGGKLRRTGIRNGRLSS
jgi:hypothetical protein